MKQRKVKRVKLRKPKTKNFTVEELREFGPRLTKSHLGAKPAELGPQFVYLDQMFEDRAAGRPCTEDQIDVLFEIAKLHVLKASRGTPGGLSWKGKGGVNQNLRARQCVLTLVQIGEEVHGPIVPPQRTGTLRLRSIIARAIKLMEDKFPELRGLVQPPTGKRNRFDQEDIRNSMSWKPTKAMLAYVKKHFPDAAEQMRYLPEPTRRGGFKHS